MNRRTTRQTRKQGNVKKAGDSRARLEELCSRRALESPAGILALASPGRKKRGHARNPLLAGNLLAYAVRQRLDPDVLLSR